MTADPPTPPEDADHDHESEGGLPPRPWERQPNEESPAAWNAFQKYRDMGIRRTLDAVDLELYPPAAPETRPPSAKRRRRNGTVSAWSIRHNWVARAAAWDAECDREARLAQIEEVREMGVRHAQLARALQARAVEALQSLSPADMAATDILRYLIEAAKLERLALGEPTDRSEQKVSGGTSLVVVERLVPVRGDKAVGSPAGGPGAADAAPVTHRLIEAVAEGEEDDPAAWVLPDEPPSFITRRP